MTIRFVLDPPLTDDLRKRIVALWLEVTNAGGAVGFVPPVTSADVQPVADLTFAGVLDGDDRLLIGLDEGAVTGTGERLVALLVISSNRFHLKDHWRILKRVMVAPDSQGLGYGAALMREAAEVACTMNMSALQVTVRGGERIEGFYRGLGYREVGRLPGALRVAPGDDRDEILMWLDLR